MTIKPIYSPSDQRLIENADREGRRKPWRPKPIGYELRGRLGGRKGREIRRRCATEEEAQQVWEAELNAYNDERSSREDVPMAYTLREFVIECFLPLYVMVRQKPKGQKGTGAVLDRVILPGLGDLRLHDVTPLQLIRFMAELITKPFEVWAASDLGAVHEWRAGRGPKPTPVGWRPICASDRRRVAVTLRTMFRFAKELGLIEESPAKDLPLEDVHHRKPGQRTANKPVDPELIEQVRLEMSLRDSVLLALLYITGLRPSEAAALLWGDILDFISGEIRTKLWVKRAMSDRQSFDPKSIERWIALFEPLRQELQRWYLELCRIRGRDVLPHEVAFPPLGPRTSYEHLHMGNWSNQNLRRACRRAGVEPFNAYRMRATCCALLAAGGDESSPGVPWVLTEIAHFLGHTPDVCWKYYWDIFEHPERYRRIPIEAHVRQAREAAERRRADLMAELDALIRTSGLDALVADLNRRSYPRPKSASEWTTESARALLRSTGLIAFDPDLLSSRIRQLADLPVTEIARRLNDEGLANSLGARWTPSAVWGRLDAMGIRPVRIGDPRLAEKRVAALADGTRSNPQIAALLNAEGLVTHLGHAWTRAGVREVRKRLAAQGITSAE